MKARGQLDWASVVMGTDQSLGEGEAVGLLCVDDDGVTVAPNGRDPWCHPWPEVREWTQLALPSVRRRKQLLVSAIRVVPLGDGKGRWHRTVVSLTCSSRDAHTLHDAALQHLFDGVQVRVGGPSGNRESRITRVHSATEVARWRQAPGNDLIVSRIHELERMMAEAEDRFDAIVECGEDANVRELAVVCDSGRVAAREAAVLESACLPRDTEAVNRADERLVLWVRRWETAGVILRTAEG